MKEIFWYVSLRRNNNKNRLMMIWRTHGKYSFCYYYFFVVTAQAKIIPNSVEWNSHSILSKLFLHLHLFISKKIFLFSHFSGYYTISRRLLRNSWGYPVSCGYTVVDMLVCWPDAPGFISQWKVNILRTCMFHIATCIYESWILVQAMEQKLNAFKFKNCGHMAPG